MAEEIKVKLTFHKNGVVGPALKSMTLAAGIVSICHPAISAADFSNLPKLGDGLFQISFDQQNQESKVSQLQAWLLSKAVQELARGVRATLEEAYFYVHVLERLKEWKTFGDLQDGTSEVRQKANRLNFPDLADAVQTQLHSKLEFVDEFRSLQAVRNCLEHRDGVVAHIDLNGSNELILTLPRMKIFTMAGDQEVELVKGQYFEKETKILMKREVRSRSYSIGQRITFEPEEFHEIAFACWFFAQDIGAKLPEVGATTEGPADGTEA